MKDQNAINKAQTKAHFGKARKKNQFGGAEHPEQQRIPTEEKKSQSQFNC